MGLVCREQEDDHGCTYETTARLWFRVGAPPPTQDANEQKVKIYSNLYAIALSIVIHGS